MLKTNAQTAFSLRMLATAPRPTSWPMLARAHCIFHQPPSRFSGNAPSRMKVIRLPLGATKSVFPRSPENVRGSEKNQPPTDETRSGPSFLQPSQYPTTSIEQSETFFHVTIFLWGCTDTQAQGALGALEVGFNATRFASSARKSKGFLKLRTWTWKRGDCSSLIPCRDQIGISGHLHRNRQAALRSVCTSCGQ